VVRRTTPEKAPMIQKSSLIENFSLLRTYPRKAVQMGAVCTRRTAITTGTYLIPMTKVVNYMVCTRHRAQRVQMLSFGTS
jgi:hypothetical protein